MKRVTEVLGASGLVLALALGGSGLVLSLPLPSLAQVRTLPTQTVTNTLALSSPIDEIPGTPSISGKPMAGSRGPRAGQRKASEASSRSGTMCRRRPTTPSRRRTIRRTAGREYDHGPPPWGRTWHRRHRGHAQNNDRDRHRCRQGRGMDPRGRQQLAMRPACGNGVVRSN